MPRWTNFPNGITSQGVPTFGTGGLPPFTGNYFFVQENSSLGAGVAGGLGTVQSPFNTIQQALAGCVSGHDDVIFLMEGSVHVSATQGSIAWNLNDTHLIGICSPMLRGKRARVSVTGTTGFNQLFLVTGTGCYFANFQIFYGFPNTSSALVAWEDDGGRNTYDNVEFLGFGDGTVSTGTANLTGARAFKMNTSTGETTFRNCVFGVDTETRNATNYTIEIAGAAPRVTFDNCDFEAYIGSTGASGSHVLIGANGIDRYLNFNNCRFLNAVGAGATTMTQAMNLNASAGGRVYLNNGTTGDGFTHWETAQSGSLYGSVPIPVAADMGKALEVNT
jgi:hypothetical protein